MGPATARPASTERPGSGTAGRRAKALWIGGQGIGRFLNKEIDQNNLLSPYMIESRQSLLRGEWPDAHLAEARSHAVLLVQRVASELRGRVPDITSELMEALNAFFPELAERQHESGYMERSANDNLDNIFSMLDRNIDAFDTDPPPSALYWPRHMAHQACPSTC